MATRNTRFWITIMIVIEALGAFFGGVFFSVWGTELTSPPWRIAMSVPGEHKTWGTVLLCSGLLFLMGLEWTRQWPRVLGCVIVGTTYLGMGVVLTWASFSRPENAMNGSMGAWIILGVITLCLAGFMWSERRIEILEKRRRHDWSRR